MSRNEYREELNGRQIEAVNTTEGPLLVIAGAGAGKTKTLTYRILNLIKKGVQPSNILAITFTNKAAKEMRDRVFQLIESDKTLNIPISFAEKPFVSTFHSLGVHILKENSRLLNLPRHFNIYDRNDSKKIIKNEMEAISIDTKENDPASVLNAISREKGDGITYDTYRKGGANNQKGYFQQMVSQVWEMYEKALAKEKALDFDDLLLKTVILLKQNEDIRQRYSGIWKYIHIDEYQDTNKVQYDIANLLAKDHKNICIVGDSDQSIYGWRGANIENILNFEKEYPETKTVALEENYRSTQNILAAANNVIRKNRLRHEKNLFTKNSEGEKLDLNIAYTEYDEARKIADTAHGLIGEGVEPKEIAVLYRANFQSRIIEEAFLKKNIPYQVVGTKFFDRKEVKDIISFVRASLNRDSASDLVRIINVPPRGIGKASIAKVIAGRTETLTPALQKKVAGFLSLLDKIADFSIKNPPSQTIKYILEETGLETKYKNGSIEEQEKFENLMELVSVATQYDGLSAGEGIEKFLENVALATDQDELEEETNAVKLMTVHASKGLEFDYVFITGLEEDLFPHQKIDRDDVSQKDKEEERRLFYVALTRARKKVFLSYTRLRTIYGSQTTNTPSQFISDIGDEFIEPVVDIAEPTGIKAIFIDF